MIAIDTDVLAVYHIFHNNPRYNATRNFFAKISGQPRAVTIFNLLELCGLFASANRVKESKNIFERYIKAENITILFPLFASEHKQAFWLTLVSECFSRIQKGMRLGDAVILWTLETNENIDSFVTWNTKHFSDKTPIKLLSPPDFL
ncbi:MAG: hypothetical protein A2Y97_04300 [Nitrospirae bacterium RBG_13_39_12]|nr:MAG: hypothetical protein A2Y97_04300 [Nitrospirae bacterium RBG_13_39_12]